MNEQMNKKQETEPSADTGWEDLAGTQLEVPQPILETAPDNNEAPINERIKIDSARENVLQMMAVESREATPLTKEQAAKEYLDILTELGKDFTNPRSVDNKLPNGDSRRIGTGANGFIEKYAPEHMDRNYSISQAAKVLDAEIVWREAGQQYKEARDELIKLEADRKEENIFKRLFTMNKFRKNKKELQDYAYAARIRSSKAGRAIAGILAVQYSESGENSAYPKDQEEQYDKNDELSARFFSENRAQAIERAIELRKQYLIGNNPSLQLRKTKATELVSLGEL
jgi:uncharacterized protein YrzB (UPF0473 family)